MLKKYLIPLSIIVLFGAFVSGSVFFTLNQAQQAIVLQFGELQTVHSDPGLKFKFPFIQEVIFYDNRVLDYDLPAITVTTVDQKRIVIDTYTRYRISDPLMFFKSIKPANELGARIRLEPIINSAARNVLGKNNLRTLLSEERSNLMKQIQAEVILFAKELGLTIIDVRIIRTELPSENRTAVFARMNSELIQIAKQNRAQGEEMAQGIRARADRERAGLLADASKQDQTIRGEGDSEALKIINKAMEKDPQFYQFYRTLQAYVAIFQQDTPVILSTDNDLLKLFQDVDSLFKNFKYHAPKSQK